MNDLVYIDLMCHALGFDPIETRRKQRKYEYYRNNFVVIDDKKWNYLVEIGFAKKISGNKIYGNYYTVTNKGINYLEKIYKIKFIPRG